MKENLRTNLEKVAKKAVPAALGTLAVISLANPAAAAEKPATKANKVLTAPKPGKVTESHKTPKTPEAKQLSVEATLGQEIAAGKPVTVLSGTITSNLYENGSAVGTHFVEMPIVTEKPVNTNGDPNNIANFKYRFFGVRYDAKSKKPIVKEIKVDSGWRYLGGIGYTSDGQAITNPTLEQAGATKAVIFPEVDNTKANYGQKQLKPSDAYNVKYYPETDGTKLYAAWVQVAYEGTFKAQNVPKMSAISPAPATPTPPEVTPQS